MLTSAFSSLQRILSWAPHFPDRPAPAQTLQIAPSDLLESMPNSAREFRINPLCKVITEEVDDWAAENIALSLPRAKKTTLIVDSPSAWDKGEEDDEIVDLKIGLLGSLCFPKADPLQLRLCCKFLTWLWLLHYHLVYINGEEGRNCVEENIRLLENEPGSTEIVNAGFIRGLQKLVRLPMIVDLSAFLRLLFKCSPPARTFSRIGLHLRSLQNSSSRLSTAFVGTLLRAS